MTILAITYFTAECVLFTVNQQLNIRLGFSTNKIQNLIYHILILRCKCLFCEAIFSKLLDAWTYLSMLYFGTFYSSKTEGRALSAGTNFMESELTQ